jgi:hypothetical protein
MKAKNLIILSAGALMLAGCGSAGIHLFEPIKNFEVGGTESLYVRGTIGGVNHWDSGYDAYTLTYIDSTSAINYQFKGITFAAGDSFKIGGTAWAIAEVNYSQLLTTTHLSSSGNSNIDVVDAGTYDVYLSTTMAAPYWKLAVVPTAASLLAAADKNLTRTTNMYVSNDYMTGTVQQYDHFKDCITTSRVTNFVEGGLYMHTDNDTINSGYYSKTSENSGNNMYHYTLTGGYTTNFSNESATIENQREDSKTTSVDDFFINGHYFTTNAATIGAKFSYDIVHLNYYSDSATAGDALVTDFMHFTAPLFTNYIDNETTKVTFKGLGLKDGGSEGVFYYMYTDDAILASGANTVFSSAKVSNIGTTTIPFLAKYIAA